ncbi:MAG TPA: hypothetical protein VFR90_09035 [Methylibium sp.]|uniref:hypothetical protein n=1 Tax=Methylibium sp. TaxID=2067992 RepID=UPI002DB82ED2|nr:hypothetical protein [Methylibium sp.]HEU4459251.1 hypothetical protein [Methylibium sp.]
MLDSLAASLGATLEASFWPPFIDRAILALNHVLRGDEAASQRLVVHAGKTLRIDWLTRPGPWPKPPALRLAVTPAGLFEALPVAHEGAAADALTITVDLPAPLAAARMLAEAARPQTQVQGDTALAADIAWLAEHLRWDAEHDLARVIGDVPARWIATAAGAAVVAMKGLAAAARRRREPGAPDAGAAAPR